MTQQDKRVLVFALAILAWASVACASAMPPAQPPPEDCPAKPPRLEVTATVRVNAADSAEGRPVQLRLYQLKNDAALRNATFEEIWQQDETVLKDDLVKREEHTAYPGKTSVLELNTSPEASKLAVVALFREPQGNDWFVTYELDTPPAKPPCPSKGPRIAIWLDRMQIQDGEGREREGASSGGSPSD